MTVYTSNSATGNWNDGSKWSGGSGSDFPDGTDDEAIIASGHQRTIPSGVTINCVVTYNAGATGMTVNGRLNLAANLLLVGSSFLRGTGQGTLDLCGFTITCANPSEYTFTGTSPSLRYTIISTGSRGDFIQATNGYTPNFENCDISGLNNPVFGATHGGATNFARFVYVRFSDCVTLTLNAVDAQANSGFLVDHCDFRTQAHATAETSSKYYPEIQCTGAFGTQQRTVSNCTWDKTGGQNCPVLINAKSTTFTNNVVNNAKLYFQQSTERAIVTNSFLANALAESFFKDGYAQFEEFGGNYLYYAQGGHPCSLLDGPFMISDNVFDGTDCQDGTNWFLVGSPSTPITFQRNLCLGKGVFLTFTTSGAPTLHMSRNTCYMDNAGVTAGVPSQYFPPLLLTEQTCTLTGTVRVYDNLIVDPDSSTARDAMVDLITATVNQIDVCDYNAGWGYPIGASTPPVLYRAAGANLSGFGAHDIAADPLFVAKTRNLATWDAANGGPGTVTNAITELLKLNESGFDTDYTVANLFAWVRGGFVPTNAALKGTGRFGGDIGALAVTVPGGGLFRHPGMQGGLAG